MTRERAIAVIGRMIAGSKADCVMLLQDETDALIYARNVLMLQESADKAEMEKRNEDGKCNGM